MRNTGEIFKLIENIKEILENTNHYISIYPNVGAGAGDTEFSKNIRCLLNVRVGKL
jgi:hypothetical protein